MSIGSLLGVTVFEMEGQAGAERGNVGKPLRHGVFAELHQPQHFTDDFFERPVTHDHRLWSVRRDAAVPVALPAQIFGAVRERVDFCGQGLSATIAFDEKRQIVMARDAAVLPVFVDFRMCAALFFRPLRPPKNKVRFCVLPAVAQIGSLFRRAVLDFHAVPDDEFFLRALIGLGADDCGMRSLRVVHGQLSAVLHELVRYMTLCEVLLHHGVPDVFFLMQHVQNGHVRKVFPVVGPHSLIVQLLRDHIGRIPGKEHIEDTAHDRRLGLLDHHLSVFHPVAVKNTPARLALFIPLSDAPFDVLGDGTAFFLGERSEDGQHQLAIPVHRMYALVLEPDVHADLFQMPDRLQQVDGVAGEAADRLYQHDVHTSGFAVRDEPVELAALLGAGAGDRIIGVNPSVYEQHPFS